MLLFGFNEFPRNWFGRFFLFVYFRELLPEQTMLSQSQRINQKRRYRCSVRPSSVWAFMTQVP